MSEVLVHHQNDDALDLSAMVGWVFEGIQALWAPTAKDIDAERDDFGRFVWSVAGPLLVQPVSQVDGLIAAAATQKTLKAFREHVECRAFKAWIARSEQEGKVKALRPQPQSKSERATELASDVMARWDLLNPLIKTASAMRGVHRPAQADLDKAHARFLVNALAMLVAANATDAQFPALNVSRVYDAASRAIFDLARLHRIAFDKLITKHDTAKVDRFESAVLASERAVQSRLQAVRSQDDDALLYIEH